MGFGILIGALRPFLIVLACGQTHLTAVGWGEGGGSYFGLSILPLDLLCFARSLPPLPPHPSLPQHPSLPTLYYVHF